MYQTKHLLQLLPLVFLLAMGCQNNSTAEDGKEEETALNSEATTSFEQPSLEANAPEAAPVKQKEMLYSWVDPLNVRDQPTLKGKTIGTVDSDDALAFTGVKSDKAETIVLRGGAYHDFWYKVILPGGQEGWVYGGAVRREGERKGNAPITEMQFDYQKFGRYDLSSWQLINKEGLGEEVDGYSTAYMNSSRNLFTTENPSMGEFGYGFTQVLSASMEGDRLKYRKFYFTPSGTPGEPHEMTETVEDYEQTPPKRYTRIQKIDKHYYALNAKPMIVLGPWKEEVIMNTSN